jgi:hypothetical protein
LLLALIKPHPKEITMLEKITVTDLIEVLENGTVQVRKATRIFEDGKVISQAFERSVVLPGMDYSSYDDKVKAICACVQTEDVVQAFAASKGV